MFWRVGEENWGFVFGFGSGVWIRYPGFNMAWEKLVEITTHYIVQRWVSEYN